MKHPKRFKIIVGILLVLVALVIFAIIGFATLDTKTEGLQNYSGIKRDAALAALDFDISNDDYALYNGRSRQFVESVIPNTETTVKTPGGLSINSKKTMCTYDSNSVRYYTVTIKRIGPYGITLGKRSYNLCILG